MACTVVLMYEYFLQLPYEVDFFWKKRWTLVKVLFLWIRYFSLAILMSNTAVFMLPKPSLKVSNAYLYWQNAVIGGQILLTHIMLSARLYAMYKCSRKILFLLIGLIGGEIVTLSIISILSAIGVPPPKVKITNEPLPGVYICAVSEQHRSLRWTAYFFATVLIIEGVFLGMALWQAWQHRPSRGGSALMHRLTKESVFYFFLIFWVYVFNLVLWATNDPILTEIGIPFSFALSCTLVARLMIHMRHVHYRTVPDTVIDNRHIDQFHLSPLQFGQPTAVIGRTKD
ncbi:hypothetical protein L208DRAFT_1456275 [Tricholoma matsutake]|nr:hypothetical protein L208DRAFT_1456275 [Tricholoma matsutake 945]